MAMSTRDHCRPRAGSTAQLSRPSGAGRHDQAEAARVLGVHPNAVNPRVNATGNMVRPACWATSRRPPRRAGSPSPKSTAGGHRAGPRQHSDQLGPAVFLWTRGRCERADRPALSSSADLRCGGRGRCRPRRTAPSVHRAIQEPLEAELSIPLPSPAGDHPLAGRMARDGSGPGLRPN